MDNDTPTTICTNNAVQNNAANELKTWQDSHDLFYFIYIFINQLHLATLICPKQFVLFFFLMIDGFQENVRKDCVELFVESMISPNGRTNFLVSEGMNNN